MRSFILQNLSLSRSIIKGIFPGWASLYKSFEYNELMYRSLYYQKLLNFKWQWLKKSLYYLLDLVQFLRKIEREGFEVKIHICSNHIFSSVFHPFQRTVLQKQVPLTRWLPWVTAKRIPQSCDFLESWQHRKGQFPKYKPYVLWIFLWFDYLGIDIVTPTNSIKGAKSVWLFCH